jgi:hypothetical protein
MSVWSQRWRSGEERLSEVESKLRAGGAIVMSGGEGDRWEHQVRGGCLASARLRMALEEHGAGRQLARFRLYPHVSRTAATALAAVGLLAVVATATAAAGAFIALAGSAIALVVRGAIEASRAMGELVSAVDAAADEHLRPTSELAVG